MAVQSFTPNKNYLAFSGLTSEVYTPATYANAANNVLLTSDVLGGLISHNAAGAQTDTLPSAGLLVPLIQGAQVGSGVRFFFKASGAGTITVAAGAGGVLTGTVTITTGQIKEFLLVVTALPDQFGNGGTYTCNSLGTSTF